MKPTTWLLAAGYLVGLASGQTCPNQCSGHGLCDSPDLRCQCFDGWTGGDCSLRTCPMGVAWTDGATDDETAHQLAECSNMGVCQRQTGDCICNVNYVGASCNVLACPSNCNGHGVCKSMKHNAASKSEGEGTVYVYETPWDANKIHGCDCDNGYYGFDCSRRYCPTGDDPLSTGDVDEVQLLQCNAGGGSFTVTYNGATSEPIAIDTGAVDLATIINNIPTLGQVSVSFSESSYDVCTPDGSGVNQVVSITFLYDYGDDIPELFTTSTYTGDCSAADASDYELCGGTGLSFAAKGNTLVSTTDGVVTSQVSTKENEPCSGRGFCNYITGTCTCYPGWETSDGRGNSGGRGDCGHHLSDITSCPGEISCSGHGYCTNAPEFKCVCSAGWTSGDCSVRSCPTGKSWFDQPLSDNRAHQLAECSDMGVCDIVTGECLCRFGFEGGACQHSSCPGWTPCSGHGQCLTMEYLAQESRINGVTHAYTYGAVANDPLAWDYDMMQGCRCDEGYAGYDCSLRECPMGDDPDTSSLVGITQNNELQVVRCTADGGSLALVFRDQISSTLTFDATDTEVQDALMALSTIHGNVEVVYSSGAAFCTLAGTNYVSIEYQGNFGDLPDIDVIYATSPNELTISSGAVSVVVTSDGGIDGGITSVQGTKENEECSNRGHCDTSLGVCSCFTGYGSSDGQNSKGDRGDCGWKMPFYSVQD